ncbi:helix-turn-helix domain-containing protein [Bradyrhizobium erythrophlei]|nr:helix-turn-helix domain-containing protein [Bradyrhizobium erythrophlei]
MAVTALSTLLAHKAINLATELSNSEKRVAAAIIDHFNRKTAQCDPSLDRISDLIGMSRRTVVRSINRLVELGYIRRVRHGGHFHRNSYEPVWLRFTQVVAEWNARRSRRRLQKSETEVTPCSGQACHFDSDKVGPQTFQKNLLRGTLATAVSHTAIARSASKSEKGLARQAKHYPESSNSQGVLWSPASRSVARDAAERRWNRDLFDRYGDQPSLYGQIVEAIDPNLMRETTDAELQLRGSGLRSLLNELLARKSTVVASPKPIALDPGGDQNSTAPGSGPVS